MTDRSVSERITRRLSLTALGLFYLLAAGCNQIERPNIEPFYAVSVPPRIQELRWTNGKSPSSYDPARAASSPETDLIRATYEGLTELDSKTLKPIPAVAVSWRSTEDLRTWTFHLRREAKWSNGEPVTAQDFVRSWKRLLELGEQTANNHLFQNIVGMDTWDSPKDRRGGETLDFLRSPPPDNETSPSTSAPDNRELPRSQPAIMPTPSRLVLETVLPVEDKGDLKDLDKKFGVTAVEDYVLRVTLSIPDKDFPKLVANPIFSPVFGDGVNFEASPKDPEAPTNGPFRIIRSEQGSITLGRSESYWNKDSIRLTQVRLVAAATAEAALDAYRKGEVDVVTNAPFEPVAIKLLTPFEDFRRTPHNAVNFYEVNTDRHPFSDRRIRQALAFSIDREKLTYGDLQGTTQPASSYSPLRQKRTDNYAFDIKKATDLLEKAGYPGGNGFPPIRLVINRNDVQQRVAASIARMWKQTLNLDAVIIVKEASEMDEVRRTGDFDLLRRGVVLPTNDELVNLAAVRGTGRKGLAAAKKEPALVSGRPLPTATQSELEIGSESLPAVPTADDDIVDIPEIPDGTDEALFEMTAIPLYFPTSYSLIKPYIRGFELNGLDAPSLKEVSIDIDWQPGKPENES
ncbi:hypothetical protein BH20ACI2_BH20ACI2_14500 [soil metagenome]